MRNILGDNLKLGCGDRCSPEFTKLSCILKRSDFNGISYSTIKILKAMWGKSKLQQGNHNAGLWRCRGKACVSTVDNCYVFQEVVGLLEFC